MYYKLLGRGGIGVEGRGVEGYVKKESRNFLLKFLKFYLSNRGPAIPVTVVPLSLPSRSPTFRYRRPRFNPW